MYGVPTGDGVFPILQCGKNRKGGAESHFRKSTIPPAGGCSGAGCQFRNRANPPQGDAAARYANSARGR
ncbi:MAG: hypothetical protein RR865_12850, partial [Clostridia bacterium]